jgi:hypothetical protein
MSYSDYALIACAAFTMALLSFPNMAANMGWRTGRLFALPATVVTLISGLIAVGLLFHVVAGIFQGSLSLWWVLIIPVAALGGGALVTGIFGRSTGMISLVASPVLSMMASYFHFSGL